MILEVASLKKWQWI